MPATNPAAWHTVDAAAGMWRPIERRRQRRGRPDDARPGGCRQSHGFGQSRLPDAGDGRPLPRQPLGTVAPHCAFPPAQYEMNRRFVGSDNPELRQFGASNNLVRGFHRVLRVHDMRGAGTQSLIGGACFSLPFVSSRASTAPPGVCQHSETRHSLRKPKPPPSLAAPCSPRACSTMSRFPEVHAVRPARVLSPAPIFEEPRTKLPWRRACRQSRPCPLPGIARDSPPWRRPSWQ